MHAMLRSLTLLLVGLPLAACGSTGTSDYTKSDITGIPMTIKLVDYRNGNVVRLVNDSHSDRVETYSTERHTAGTKVASDEIVAETIKYVKEQGFDRYAVRGMAPFRSSDYNKALEIDDPDGVRYFALHPGSTQEEFQTMNACAVGLIQIYNNVHAAQAVTNTSGADLFDQQKRALQQQNQQQLREQNR